jgi:hypothetical protein
MKKHFTLMCAGLLISALSFAQISLSDFSAGVAGNYSMYKGDLKKSVPGIKVEVNYGVYEKVGFTVGFTKGFGAKQVSSISSTNDFGGSKTTESEITYKFSTISVASHYRLVGDDESTFQGYIPFGASVVIVKYDEKAKEAIPAGYTAVDQLEAGSANGFTINLGVGAQYTVGMPVIFAEAGISLPANKVNNGYVENPIPMHFAFNVGVRVPFGARATN